VGGLSGAAPFGAHPVVRRLGQALLLLPLWVLALAVQAAVRLAAGGDWPGWGYFGSAFANAALWPLLSYALLWPQWRAVRSDASASLS